MNKIIAILISIIILFSSKVFALEPNEILGYIPQPNLKAPQGEIIDLTGKTELTFSWGRHVGQNGLGKYYDFRLYRGTEITASSLMLKKKVSGNTYKIEIPSNLFENRGVYTWSLKLCYKSLGKSQRTIETFEVIRE